MNKSIIKHLKKGNNMKIKKTLLIKKIVDRKISQVKENTKKCQMCHPCGLFS